MKTIRSLVGILSLVAAASAGAALTVQDQYLIDPPDAGQYFPGTVLGQGPSVTGFVGTYSGDSNVSIVEEGLNYSGMITAGGALRAVPFGRAGRSLSTTYDNQFAGTVFVGFLLQLGDTSDGQLPSYAAFELFNGNSRGLQLGASPGDFGTSTNWGLRVNDNNGLRLTLDAASTDATLFVLKIDFSASPSSDAITVYQNPTDLSSEFGNVAIGTLGGFDLSFNNIRLANYSGNSGSITLDELRMGSSFGEATGAIPEPGTLALLTLGVAAVTFLRKRRIA
jgi:hypothetical protein